MNINSEPDRLKEEEQSILNELIAEMDKVINSLDKKMQTYVDEAKNIDIALNPDSYLSRILNVNGLKDTEENRKKILQARDELYHTRLLLECSDDNGTDVDEIKVGLHSCQHMAQTFVTSWKMPICRHYLLDNSSTEFESIVTNKHGEKFHAHYRLLVKNQVTLRFTRVVKALNLYPGMLDEELLKICKDSKFFDSKYIDELIAEFNPDEYDPDSAAQIIADEFLQELLERRSSPEFKNIVFSIQKKQGEIIQAPYNKNMIVQGCAGSGKSMIMLHRLPIILYDNPNSLNRTNLYIITPSQMYIQLAENMRHQLEISDVKMGTIEQYYDYCIGKYNGHTAGEYGKVRHVAKIDADTEKYIYSVKCVADINRYFEKLSDINNSTFEKAVNIFSIEQDSYQRSDSYAQKITSKLLLTQRIINENDKVLSLYFNRIKAVQTSLQKIAVIAKYRRQNVIREITKLITQNEEKILKAEKELKKLNVDDNEKAIENRQTIISGAQSNTQQLKEEILQINIDDEYFDLMKKCGKKIETVLLPFSELKPEFSQNDTDVVYAAIDKIGQLIGSFFMISWELGKIDDKYAEYLGKIKKEIDNVQALVEELQNTDEKYLHISDYNEVLNLSDELRKISSNAAKNAYIMIMKKIGIKENSDGKMPAQNYSPYLYLQALYHFQGSPNSTKEALLSIDEAQGIAPEELRLLQNINGGKVIFNMFGDVYQHIENTKGIDSWNEFSDIVDYDLYEMKENYRNSSQVTEYCNKVFTMDMIAINTPGKGVHEIKDEKSFKDILIAQLLDTGRAGIAAILVGDDKEAKYLLDTFAEYNQKFHDMTVEEFSIHRTRWNIMNIDDAKGLEFSSVIVLSGRMSKNEKYIAYTRALDELFVYSIVIDIDDYRGKNKRNADVSEKNNEAEIKNDENNNEEKAVHTKHQRIVTSLNSAVKDFFEEKGFEVKDMRNEGGRLWVIGEKVVIRDTVNAAIAKFGISGKYASGKEINNRNGWFTKTNK